MVVKMRKLVASLIVFVFLSVQFNLALSYAQLGETMNCANEDCSEPISQGKAKLAYQPRDKKFLNLKKNDIVLVKSKKAGQKTSLWGGQDFLSSTKNEEESSAFMLRDQKIKIQRQSSVNQIFFGSHQSINDKQTTEEMSKLSISDSKDAKTYSEKKVDLSANDQTNDENMNVHSIFSENAIAMVVSSNEDKIIQNPNNLTPNDPNVLKEKSSLSNDDSVSEQTKSSATSDNPIKKQAMNNLLSSKTTVLNETLFRIPNLLKSQRKDTQTINDMHHVENVNDDDDFEKNNDISKTDTTEEVFTDVVGFIEKPELDVVSNHIGNGLIVVSKSDEKLNDYDESLNQKSPSHIEENSVINSRNSNIAFKESKLDDSKALDCVTNSDKKVGENENFSLTNGERNNNIDALFSTIKHPDKFGISSSKKPLDSIDLTISEKNLVDNSNTVDHSTTDDSNNNIHSNDIANEKKNVAIAVDSVVGEELRNFDINSNSEKSVDAIDSTISEKDELKDTTTTAHSIDNNNIQENGSLFSAKDETHDTNASAPTIRISSSDFDITNNSKKSVTQIDQSIFETNKADNTASVYSVDRNIIQENGNLSPASDETNDVFDTPVSTIGKRSDDLDISVSSEKNMAKNKKNRGEFMKSDNNPRINGAQRHGEFASQHIDFPRNTYKLEKVTTFEDVYIEDNEMHSIMNSNEDKKNPLVAIGSSLGNKNSHELNSETFEQLKFADINVTDNNCNELQKGDQKSNISSVEFSAVMSNSDEKFTLYNKQTSVSEDNDLKNTLPDNASGEKNLINYLGKKSKNENVNFITDTPSFKEKFDSLQNDETLSDTTNFKEPFEIKEKSKLTYNLPHETNKKKNNLNSANFKIYLKSLEDDKTNCDMNTSLNQDVFENSSLVQEDLYLSKTGENANYIGSKNNVAYTNEIPVVTVTDYAKSNKNNIEKMTEIIEDGNVDKLSEKINLLHDSYKQPVALENINKVSVKHMDEFTDSKEVGNVLTNKMQNNINTLNSVQDLAISHSAKQNNFDDPTQSNSDKKIVSSIVVNQFDENIYSESDGNVIANGIRLNLHGNYETILQSDSSKNSGTNFMPIKVNVEKSPDFSISERVKTKNAICSYSKFINESNDLIDVEIQNNRDAHIAISKSLSDQINDNSKPQKYYFEKNKNLQMLKSTVDFSDNQDKLFDVLHSMNAQKDVSALSSSIKQIKGASINKRLKDDSSVLVVKEKQSAGIANAAKNQNSLNFFKDERTSLDKDKVVIQDVKSDSVTIEYQQQIVTKDVKNFDKVQNSAEYFDQNSELLINDIKPLFDDSKQPGLLKNSMKDSQTQKTSIDDSTTFDISEERAKTKTLVSSNAKEESHNVFNLMHRDYEDPQTPSSKDSINPNIYKSKTITDNDSFSTLKNTDGFFNHRTKRKKPDNMNLQKNILQTFAIAESIEQNVTEAISQPLNDEISGLSVRDTQIDDNRLMKFDDHTAKNQNSARNHQASLGIKNVISKNDISDSLSLSNIQQAEVVADFKKAEINDEYLKQNCDLPIREIDPSLDTSRKTALSKKSIKINFKSTEIKNTSLDNINGDIGLIKGFPNMVNLKNQQVDDVQAYSEIANPKIMIYKSEKKNLQSTVGSTDFSNIKVDNGKSYKFTENLEVSLVSKLEKQTKQDDIALLATEREAKIMKNKLETLESHLVHNNNNYASKEFISSILAEADVLMKKILSLEHEVAEKKKIEENYKSFIEKKEAKMEERIKVLEAELKRRKNNEGILYAVQYEAASLKEKFSILNEKVSAEKSKNNHLLMSRLSQLEKEVSMQRYNESESVLQAQLDTKKIRDRIIQLEHTILEKHIISESNGAIELQQLKYQLQNLENELKDEMVNKTDLILKFLKREEQLETKINLLEEKLKIDQSKKEIRNVAEKTIQNRILSLEMLWKEEKSKDKSKIHKDEVLQMLKEHMKNNEDALKEMGNIMLSKQKCLNEENFPGTYFIQDNQEVFDKSLEATTAAMRSEQNRKPTIRSNDLEDSSSDIPPADFYKKVHEGKLVDWDESVVKNVVKKASWDEELGFLEEEKELRNIEDFTKNVLLNDTTDGFHSKLVSLADMDKTSLEESVSLDDNEDENTMENKLKIEIENEISVSIHKITAANTNTMVSLDSTVKTKNDLDLQKDALLNEDKSLFKLDDESTSKGQIQKPTSVDELFLESKDQEESYAQTDDVEITAVKLLFLLLELPQDVFYILKPLESFWLVLLPDEYHEGAFGVSWFSLFLTLLVGFITIFLLFCIKNKKNKRSIYTDVEELQYQIAEMIKEKVDVENELQLLQMKTEELKKSFDKEKELNASTLLQCKNLKKISEECQQAYNKKVSEINEFTKSLENISKEKDLLKNEVDNTTKKLEEQKKSNLDLSNNISRVTDELEKNIKQNNNLDEKLQEYESCMMKKNDEIKVQMSELSQWKVKTNDLQEQIDKLKTKISSITDEKEQIKQEADILKDCLLQFRGVQEALTDDGEENLDSDELIEKHKEKMKNLVDVQHIQKKIKQVQIEKGKILVELESERKEREAKEGCIAKLEAECEKIKSLQEKAQRELEVYQAKLNVMQDFYTKREVEIQGKLGKEQSDREKNEIKLAEETDKIKYLQEQISIYKQMKTDAVKQFEENEKKLKIEITSYEKKAHDNWISYRQAQRKLEETNRESSHLRAEVNDLQNELQKLEDLTTRPRIIPFDRPPLSDYSPSMRMQGRRSPAGSLHSDYGPSDRPLSRPHPDRRPPSRSNPAIDPLELGDAARNVSSHPGLRSIKDSTISVEPFRLNDSQFRKVSPLQAPLASTFLSANSSPCGKKIGAPMVSRPDPPGMLQSASSITETNFVSSLDTSVFSAKQNVSSKQSTMADGTRFSPHISEKKKDSLKTQLTQLGTFTRDGAPPPFIHDIPPPIMHGPPPITRGSHPSIPRDGFPSVPRDGPPHMLRNGPPRMSRDGPPPMPCDGPPLMPRDGPSHMPLDGPPTLPRDGLPPIPRGGPPHRFREGPLVLRDGPPPMMHHGLPPMHSMFGHDPATSTENWYSMPQPVENVRADKIRRPGSRQDGPDHLNRQPILQSGPTMIPLHGNRPCESNPREMC